MPTHNLIAGLPWIFANMLFAVADRLLQRMMLAKEQRPVDISLTGVTLISNFWGFVILIFFAWLKNEFAEISMVSSLSGLQIFFIVGSCIVGSCNCWHGYLVFWYRRCLVYRFFSLLEVALL